MPQVGGLLRLTIGEVTQCVTCRVLILGRSRGWECDDYRDTKPETMIDEIVVHTRIELTAR